MKLANRKSSLPRFPKSTRKFLIRSKMKKKRNLKNLPSQLQSLRPSPLKKRKQNLVRNTVKKVTMIVKTQKKSSLQAVQEIQL